MNPTYLRQFHASQVFHALRAHPNISQRELCVLTGCDKSTVSVIIKRFEAMGLVERAQGQPRGTRGRPQESLRISLNSGFLLGVHLEFEQLVLVLATLDGQPLDSWRGPLPADPGVLGPLLTEGVAVMLQGQPQPVADIRSVGVCLPGLVGMGGGLAFSPNLGWRDVNVPELLAPYLPVPVQADNDTNAATLAEHLFGDCIGIDDFLLIEGGEGIGGGMFMDGRVYRGKSGFAGELGHQKVNANGRPCNCGAMGCLAAYVAQGVLLERAGHSAPGIASLTDLQAAAVAGQRGVLGLLDESGGYVGLVLSNLINALNPPAVVLSGTLARLWPWLEAGVRRSLSENALPAPLSQVDIIISSLSTGSVPLGGVALALEGFTSLDAPEALFG
ncbi:MULTISPECIES: ROK family transcriptional regulator [Pantoea]|mgnify:CR=1 FL=1|uniref:ROK family transcriptional regulator n=1 Tax=Pantoea TaxID=53335 RepID=UPI0016548B8D|nr:MULTISPECIES: ROK family transcriptional regulator [Pantoea]